MRHVGLRALVLLLLALSSGCYRVIAPNSVLPRGIASVSAPVFINRTAEPTAEVVFTQALRDALIRAGRLGDSSDVDSLEGEIVSISSGPILTASKGMPVYRLQCVMALTLKHQGVVVQRVDQPGFDDVPPGADVLWLETNRALALRRLAERTVNDALTALSGQVAVP